MLRDLGFHLLRDAVDFGLDLVGDIRPFLAGLGQEPGGRLGMTPPLRLARLLAVLPGRGLLSRALVSLPRLFRLRLGELAILAPRAFLLFGLGRLLRLLGVLRLVGLRLGALRRLLRLFPSAAVVPTFQALRCLGKKI